MQYNIKIHSIFIFIGCILLAFCLGTIVSFTDPLSAGVLVHALFYLSLFLFCAGMFMVTGLLIRERFSKSLYIMHVKHSMRQAMMLSMFITASLWLKAHGLLPWWVELCLLLFLLSIEIFLNL